MALSTRASAVTPPYFFRSSSFVGTLDGRGHKITGLTRGINGDGTYDYNRHYGFFAGMGGVMKNLVMEMEVAITCGETGFGNGAIIDSLTGTLENNGRKIILSDLKQDENGVWRMDYEDMENKIREAFGFRGTALKFLIRERKGEQ